MQWVCFAILQILKTCLGIWISKLIFPELRIKSGYHRILAVVLLVGMLWIQIDDYWTCFMSSGNLFLTGIMAGVICLFAVKESPFTVGIFLGFYHVSVELLKIPCLVLEGIYYQETLFWVNYGERNWAEAAWCLGIFVVIFLLIYMKQQSLHTMKRMMEKHSMSVLLLGTVEWILLSGVMWMGGKEAFSASALLVALLGIFCVLLLFLYLLLKNVWNETENEKNLMRASQDLLMKHHEELKEVYKKNNQRMHDTKHVLLYLKNCIIENRLEDAAKQIDSFVENLQNAEKVVWTGFEFPDFLINTKKALMDTKEITFRLEVDLTHIPLSDSEVGVLLGNLFDNAIEAAQKCETEKREIYVKLCNRNDMFFLRMCNTSTQCPRVNQGVFLSSKTGDIHGYGIENVRTIVQNHQGSIEFQYDEHYFEVMILI